MRKQLNQLKKAINYVEGTKTLLSIFLTSDKMIYATHMFPEVFYGDVTCSTNRQRSNLYLIVVKDANGKTFIGNASFIPSGQRWVFSTIYQSFFIHLYRAATISWKRLFLTDDVAERGPLDSCIKTMACYSYSTHMLCVFHGIVMAFHKKVYPKLPHKRGSNKKILTEKGELYGEIFCE